jgi:hypothetical protein
MYSDLLDVLGGGNAAVGASSSSSSENNKHIATSFKAGKMNLEPREGGKFWVTPDTRRGTVQLVWTSSNSLKWEWKCRRNNDEVVDSFDVTPGATFERVESPTGRVYVLSQPRCMYWMQDASDENDDDICVQVNQYLANPDEAKPEGSSGDAAMAQAMQTSSSTTTTTTNSSSGGNTNQVDALSNISENLGMPQQNQQQSTATATTGTLTLADLQGAMSGLGASTAPAAAAAAAAGPPLQEIVTPEAISSLLEDEAVCARLLELLPEEQQTRQHLEDNLRSPQVQQTLRSLTAALAPDDAGSMEGYHSVLANFSLDPQDGQAALASGNPIQAFLDAVVASVKQDEEETKEEEEEDHAMEE